jgi:propanol-preferring alcohol dehydrogenase
MKAARLYQPGQPLKIEEVPVPKPTGEQTLIRIAGAGVCHSDLHIIRGHMNMPLQLPRTLGHENAGYIEEMGPDVTGFQKGEAVAVFGGWGDGTCYYCRNGEEQLCNTLTWVGIGADGGYAEYLLVPHQRYLVKLEGLDPVEAAPLTDAALTPYRAVKKVLPNLVPGTFAAVIGLGGLGQFGLQFLKIMSAAQLIAIDVDDKKLARAKELGADFTINSAKQDATAEVKRIAGGEGAQGVLDFVGTDATLQTAVTSAARKGRVVIVGLGGGTLHYNFFAVPTEVTVSNSMWGSRSELEEVIALARQGKIQAKIERVKLEDINQTFDRLEKGQIEGRAVVTF